MSKSFSQAPKPSQLTAEVISAFERTGAGQDNRGRIPTNVEKRESTNVGDRANALNAQSTHVERMQPTNGEMGKPSDAGMGVTTKPGKAEPTRRLSIDLPESWHRRFKIACTRADKKMIDEGTVKLAESRLGGSRVGRVNGRDDDGSRPNLRRLSIPC